MRRALLAVYLDSHFAELVRVARLLRDSGRYEPLLFFARDYPARARDAARCVEESIACAGPETLLEPQADGGRADAARSSRHRLRRWLARRALLAFPVHLHRLRRELGRARRTLSDRRPELLVLAEDSVEYGTAAFVRAAHERGTPVVIVPFTVATAREPAETYWSDPAHHVRGWASRLLARLRPRWIHVHRGRPLLRLPAARALALEWLGLAPARPWVLHGGAADRIAAESDAMLDHYRREGLPEGMLHLTGSLADDELARGLREGPARRDALLRRLELPADRPLVVCVVPPDQMDTRAAVCDFATYQELVSFWVEALANSGASVILRLHPRAEASHWAPLAGPGVRLTQEDTASLVPLADVFVASVSATIRWAIACGKPVLNYDVYRYGYEDYHGAPGVITVAEPSAFVAKLRLLVAEPSFRARIEAEQRRVAPHWARLDGHSGRRLIELFDSLPSRGET